MVTVFSFISFFINLFVYNTNNSIFAIATCQQNNKTTCQHNYKATKQHSNMTTNQQVNKPTCKQGNKTTCQYVVMLTL